METYTWPQRMLSLLFRIPSGISKLSAQFSGVLPLLTDAVHFPTNVQDAPCVGPLCNYITFIQYDSKQILHIIPITLLM